MPLGGHRRSVAVFITLGSCLVALAVTLNIGWVVLNWQTGILLVARRLDAALSGDTPDARDR